LASNVLTGTLNGSYSQQFTASGGTAPYTFTAVGTVQPPGISLTLASNGLLTGSLTTAGTFGFTIRATDANSNSDTATYSLAVSAPTSTLNLYLSAGGGGSNVYDTGNNPYIDIQVFNEYAVGHVFNAGDVDVATWQISGTGITANDFLSMTIWSGATPDNDYVTINPITSLSGTMNLKYFSGGSGRNMTAVALLYVRVDGVYEGIEEFTFTVTVNGQTQSDTIFIRD
jgi:hypothetical protein